MDDANSPYVRAANITNLWALNLVSFVQFFNEDMEAFRRGGHICLEAVKSQGNLLLVPISLIGSFLMNFALVGFIMLSMASTIVAVSFLRSLHPKYKLHLPGIKEKHLTRTRATSKSASRSALAQITGQKEPVQDKKPTGGGGHGDGEAKLDHHFSQAFNGIRGNHRTPSVFGSFSESDIQSIYTRLSWSLTQIELESANWLNSSLSAFWPSIQTIVSKLILKELITVAPPTEPLLKTADSSISKGRKQEARLSVYLSCRRKLELLHRAKVKAQEKNHLGKKTLEIFLYLVKIFILNLKQFIVDQLSALMSSHKQQQQRQPQQQQQIGNQNSRSASADKNQNITINLKDMVPANKLTVKINKQRSEEKIRQDHGRPLAEVMENRVKTKRARGATRQDDSGGKSSRGGKRVVVRGLVSSDSLIKLRSRSNKCLEKVNKTFERVTNEHVTLEKLTLGNAIPKISGIKFIEPHNNLLLSDAYQINRHLPPSDAENLRLLLELSYCSDNLFSLRLNSVPIFGRFKIRGISLRLRIMVTCNHSIIGTDPELEIFESNDQVLLPLVNFTQISLVDVPQIDWNFRRVKSKKPKQATVPSRELRLSLNGIGSVFGCVRKRLNAIDLVNHPYFKYLVHLALSLILRYFRPFDIQIADRSLIIKSLY